MGFTVDRPPSMITVGRGLLARACSRGSRSLRSASARVEG